MDREVLGVLAKWGNIINDRVENRWASINGIEGNANTKKPQLSSDKITQTLILVFSGQKAWIAEFGSGSLMETDTKKNKYLARYISGRNFNKYRLNMGKYLGIKSRARGVYRDLDDNIHITTGGTPGYDLEFHGSLKGKYQPKRPMYIIQEEIKAAIPEIKEDISAALKSHVLKSIKTSLGG